MEPFLPSKGFLNQREITSEILEFNAENPQYTQIHQLAFYTPKIIEILERKRVSGRREDKTIIGAMEILSYLGKALYETYESVNSFPSRVQNLAIFFFVLRSSFFFSIVLVNYM